MLWTAKWPKENAICDLKAARVDFVKMQILHDGKRLIPLVFFDSQEDRLWHSSACASSLSATKGRERSSTSESFAIGSSRGRNPGAGSGRYAR